MVKRRRLETPSSDDLSRIEAEFRRETSGRGNTATGMAPIAQVAAESAAMANAVDADARAARLRDHADAERLRSAEEQGLLIVEIPIDQIHEGAMIRDRMVMDQEEMQELRQSIETSGLRLPIEVFALDDADGHGAQYGLLSGYRRLHAVRALWEDKHDEKYARIRSLVRPRTEADQAFVAMVEENEVREELSHFERGRIAVIASNQGAFATVEDAVNRLFATGSKAKRSKVRSFALIFEELGDMLRFPEALTEKRGLRLSAALRNGAEARLRRVLSDGGPATAEDEWAIIEDVLTQLDSPAGDGKKAGRPRTAVPTRHAWLDHLTIRTSKGVTIHRGTEGGAYILKLEGLGFDEDAMENLMTEITALLER